MFRLGGGTGGLPPGVTTNDWRAQAKRSVNGMREEKYRSAALRIEVKLAEALGEHICRCSGYIRYYEAMRDLILADPRLTKEG